MKSQNSLINVETLRAEPDDVIFLKFDPEIDPEDLQESMYAVRDAFPDNEVLGICNNMDVLSQNPKESIEMLEKMIAHIKIIVGTASDKKIIV